MPVWLFRLVAVEHEHKSCDSRPTADYSLFLAPLVFHYY